MIYFADPYPEELLFSAWVRSAEHLRYPNKHMYFAEVRGQSRGMSKPLIDFPCHLRHFVAMLPRPSSYTADTLIQYHTLYPYYRPFLPIDRAQLLYEKMCGEDGKRIYWCTRLMNTSIPRKGWFRYCPGCVEEDRSMYGECYWHRLHQIHGVLVCPKHHLMLVSCTPEEQHLADQAFMPANRLLFPKSTEWVLLPPEMEMAERIATQIAFLLEHPQLKLDTDLGHRYRLLLERGHFLTSSETIWISKVIEAFQSMFSQSLLQALQCEFDPQTPTYMTWLGRLLKHRTMCQHPLLHVLTIMLLQGSIDKFFRPLEPTPQPFGSGPWPCLNPTCPYYHELSITVCQVYHEGKARRCTGHFMCSCGFKYVRIFRDDIDQGDVSRLNEHTNIDYRDDYTDYVRNNRRNSRG